MHLDSKKKKYSIVAVVPAYNEADRIAAVIIKTRNFVDEIIVVNDGSSDMTSSIARENDAEVVDLSINRGAGYATRCGCDLAYEKKADIIVTIDADGQHCAGDIPDLIDKLTENQLDIVFGYRIQGKSSPLKKKLGNKVLSIIVRCFYGIKLKDVLTGFHAFPSSSYPLIRWRANRYVFILEYIRNVYKNKLNYAEVKIKTIYLEKQHGMRIHDGIKSMLYLLWWRCELLFDRSRNKKKD